MNIRRANKSFFNVCKVRFSFIHQRVPTVNVVKASIILSWYYWSHARWAHSCRCLCWYESLTFTLLRWIEVWFTFTGQVPYIVLIYRLAFCFHWAIVTHRGSTWSESMPTISCTEYNHKVYVNNAESSYLRGGWNTSQCVLVGLCNR